MIACVCFCANFSFLLLLHFFLSFFLSFFPITFCRCWRNLEEEEEEEEEDSFQIRSSYTVERLIFYIFFSFSTLNDNGVANVKVRFSKTVERLIIIIVFLFLFSLDDKNVAHVKLEMKTGQERCREITFFLSLTLHWQRRYPDSFTSTKFITTTFRVRKKIFPSLRLVPVPVPSPSHPPLTPTHTHIPLSCPDIVFVVVH